MNKTKIAELIATIEKQIILTERIHAAVIDAMARDISLLGKTPNAAVMVAGLIENYYTCLETAYQKISQFFENNLSPARWHAELLEKMALRIEGVRIPAVSEEAYKPLVELQRFRHFKRYYFELDYDWLRLEFILKQLDIAHRLAIVDLRKFIEFLDSL